MNIPDNFDEIQRDAMSHGFKWVFKDGEWTVETLEENKPVNTGCKHKFEYKDSFFTCIYCGKRAIVGS